MTKRAAKFSGPREAISLQGPFDPSTVSRLPPGQRVFSLQDPLTRPVAAVGIEWPAPHCEVAGVPSPFPQAVTYHVVLNIPCIQTFKEATDFWGTAEGDKEGKRDTQREKWREKGKGKEARGARGEMEKEEDWLLSAVSTLPATHRDAQHWGPQNFRPLGLRTVET